VFLKCLLYSGLHISDYLHYSGFDPVAILIYTASFGPQMLNILHQTMAYAAFVHSNHDRFSWEFENILQSSTLCPLYHLSYWKLQACLDFKLILLRNIHLS